MARVCIVDRKNKDGIPIRDDFILKSIRRIKETLNVSTGNQLIVCKDHIEEAKKRRTKFEKSLMTSAGLGAVIGVILLLISLFSGRSLIGILQSVVLLAFLVVLMASLSLYQYFPAMQEKNSKSKSKSKTKSKHNRKKR